MTEMECDHCLHWENSLVCVPSTLGEISLMMLERESVHHLHLWREISLAYMPSILAYVKELPILIKMRSHHLSRWKPK